MRRKFILFMLLLTASTTIFGSIEAGAATSVQVTTPGFNFSLNDYQPAPPHVRVYENRGRPYYVQHDRRVYMQKKHHGKKYKKHYRDNGNHYGHDNGRGNGHNKH